MTKFALAILLLFSLKGFSQFTAGNLAVLQADASASNTTGSIIELNTTTAGQSAVSTVLIDGAGVNAMRFSGSATSTGYLANSSDGTLLCFTGANNINTTANANTLNPRGVGTLNSSQTFNLATTYTGASGNQTRGVTSLNNTNWFIGDQGGFYTNGATSASPSGNIRSVKSFGSTAYAFTSTTAAAPVGIISAASGGTYTALPGLPLGNTTRQDFYLISSGANGGNYDVLYILDASSGTAGIMFKYSLVAGSWVANGTYTTSFGGFGLAAQKGGTGAYLYVSTGTGATTANSLLKLTDAAGYNTTINISTAANVTLYTAPTGKIIKGVAFAPVAPPLPTVSLSVDVNTGTEAAQTVITVTATASAPVTGNQTVNLAVTGTGITAGDYTLSNTTITILSGATTGTVTFTVVDDALVEGTETATITISNPSAGITLGMPTTQDITITDNDTRPDMRITEYMYSGNDGEFVEFTNISAAPIDMTGYSYSDNAQTPGSVSLSAFGIVQPGESVILTEANATTFRTAWGLCSNVKVIGNNATQNLGRADEINLYDNANNLVDRLTFGDQVFAGSIRTQNATGWVTAAGLGNNIAIQWTLSTVADAEGSYASTLGDIGSPGKSTRATVAYNPCPPGKMQITEYMYSSGNGEFVEFTNVGTTPVSMTGYSYSDNARVAGSVSLSAFGTVQPGESVILTETAESTFRTAWSLCSGVKIIGSNVTQNLGRSDEINLYNASNTLVDRLTYDDQTLGGPRTQNATAWVSAAGLGNNMPTQWTLSAVSDIENSYASAAGDIGSPGKSKRAVIAYDPCASLPGSPTIVVDVTATTNLLDGGATIPPPTPFALSAVLNDPIDPLANIGITFTVADDATLVAALTVTATSSNTTVVPSANIIISGNGAGASRNVKITGAAVGYADVTFTVTDGTLTTNYVIKYAVSQAVNTTTKWHTSIADASAAIALDDNYMIIANDESNLLFVYDRNLSGLPVKTYDFNPEPTNPMNLTDGAPGAWKELDLEAATQSPSTAGRIYWLGSMSNSSSFNDKPNRNRIFATQVSGTGAATTFSNVGAYGVLRQSLINWGDANGYNFTASAAAGVDPKIINGFNVEGMVFGPDNTTLYIGFRAPLVPTGSRTKAVIAPILNFETWFNNGAPFGNPTYGAPIELDLGLRGIRDIIRISNGNYVIVAGSYGSALIPAIYKWTGNPANAPTLVPTFDLTGINAEAVMPVNEGGLLSLNKLEIIADYGSAVFYNDAVEAKDLTQPNFKKFSSDIIVSSAGGPLPISFTNFNAARNTNTAVTLNWKTAQAINTKNFEILRSYNGVDFVSIDVVQATAGVDTYTYIDKNATAAKLYYRIKAIEVSTQSYVSTIRFISLDSKAETVTVYPNPVLNNIFTVSATATGNKILQVFSEAGTLYKTIKFADQSKDISTNGWAAGSYIIRIITADEKITTQKLTVQ